MPLQTVLRFVTSNPAAVLRLDIKGTLEAGKAADLLVMTKKEMEILEVISLGRRLVKEGRIAFNEKFLKDSNRRVVLEGEKADEGAEEKAVPPSQFASEKTRTAHIESFVCEGK